MDYPIYILLPVPVPINYTRTRAALSLRILPVSARLPAKACGVVLRQSLILITMVGMISTFVPASKAILHKEEICSISTRGWLQDKITRCLKKSPDLTGLQIPVFLLFRHFPISITM